MGDMDQRIQAAGALGLSHPGKMFLGCGHQAGGPLACTRFGYSLLGWHERQCKELTLHQSPAERTLGRRGKVR